MHPTIIAEHFAQKFGAKPEILVRAPGRINLIGEHTDYNDGFVLPAAIEKSVWFAASRRSDGQVLLHALDLGDSCRAELDNLRPLPDKSWANYLLGVIDELRRDGHPVGGVQVVFSGDIPPGAGLSSSAAMESGMAFVLNELFGLKRSKTDLIKLAQRAENNFVGMQCGIMDMFASVMGRENQVIRLDCRNLDFEYFPFHAPGISIVLCNSGVKHALVDSEYNTRRQECETGITLLKTAYPSITSLRDVSPGMLAAEKDHLPETVFRRCKYVVEEIERVRQAGDALQKDDLEALGALMYQTHAGLQHEYEVSCPELDFLVELTQNLPAENSLAGAVLGARMMGGGFGGCSINLVRQPAVPAFINYMQARFRERWHRDLVCYEVRLANGVERVG